MTKQTLLIMAGAVIVFAGVVWMLSADKAEAPIVAESVATEDTSTTTAVDAFTETSTTTILTNDIAQAALKNTPAPTAKPTPKPIVTQKPAVTVVTYNGKHFAPKSATILKGGTVRFLNLSDEDMWVASNIHPAHNGYPVKSAGDCAGSIFDECKAVGKGGFWDFTFDREGTWKYHNHKSPTIDGEVEVNLPGDKPVVPGY